MGRRDRRIVSRKREVATMKKGIQLRFSTDVKKPWADICCEACWTAHGEKCTCRCGGLYHGIGRKVASREKGESAIPEEAAAKIFDSIKDKRCRWCGAKLAPPVLCYEHEAGWKVAGYEKRMWLYIRCSKCGYDWALWKLGISRGATF